MANNKKFTVEISLSLHKKLVAKAKKTKNSMSEIARKALANAVK